MILIKRLRIRRECFSVTANTFPHTSHCQGRGKWARSDVSASAPFPATGPLDLPKPDCAARSMRLYDNLGGLDEGSVRADRTKKPSLEVARKSRHGLWG